MCVMMRMLSVKINTADVAASFMKTTPVCVVSNLNILIINTHISVKLTRIGCECM